MRGKAILQQIFCLIGRITPAYAGKRATNTPTSSLLKDHPRLCGEKGIFFQIEINRVGSPPPMRGKVYVNGLKLIPNGITPAYAGKSN